MALNLLVWVLVVSALLTCNSEGAARKKTRTKGGSNNKSDDDKRPNILFILIDDAGWNDLGLNGASDVHTPFLDQLATEESLILFNSYAQHWCTATRTALLTGRYPFRVGMQHDAINPTDTYGLPIKINETNAADGTVTELEIKLLPELMKEAGYGTHLIGKWHLGNCKDEYLPTNRGWDTFNGFLTAQGNHWDHHFRIGELFGYDLRNNTEAVYALGEYSSYLFGNITRNYLIDYDRYQQDTPFFIEYAAQVVHNPDQAPDECKEIYYNNTSMKKSRMRLAGMATCLDHVLERLVYTLKNETNLWDNTLVIVQSDNGAAPWHAGDSYPLRGSKTSLFEGGVRTTTFVTGGLLSPNRRGQVSQALIHVSDWYATIAEVAGILDDKGSENNEYVRRTDSVSQLGMIQRGDPGTRTEIIHNIDPYDCISQTDVCGSIRQGDWKLVIGNEVSSDNPLLSGWIKLLDVNESELTPNVDCGGPPPKYFPNPLVCPWNGHGCLYNIKDDPCEYNDVAKENPDIYDSLMEALIKYNGTQMMPLQLTHFPDDDGANPANLDGFWGPWL